MLRILFISSSFPTVFRLGIEPHAGSEEGVVFQGRPPQLNLVFTRVGDGGADVPVPQDFAFEEDACPQPHGATLGATDAVCAVSPGGQPGALQPFLEPPVMGRIAQRLVLSCCRAVRGGKEVISSPLARLRQIGFQQRHGLGQQEHQYRGLGLALEYEKLVENRAVRRGDGIYEEFANILAPGSRIDPDGKEGTVTERGLLIQALNQLGKVIISQNPTSTNQLSRVPRTSGRTVSIASA